MMSDDTIALISNYTPALLIESGDKMKKLNKLLS